MGRLQGRQRSTRAIVRHFSHDFLVRLSCELDAYQPGALKVPCKTVLKHDGPTLVRAYATVYKIGERNYFNLHVRISRKKARQAITPGGLRHATANYDPTRSAFLTNASGR